MGQLLVSFKGNTVCFSIGSNEEVDELPPTARQLHIKSLLDLHYTGEIYVLFQPIQVVGCRLRRITFVGSVQEPLEMPDVQIECKSVMTSIIFKSAWNGTSLTFVAHRRMKKDISSS